MLFSNSILRKYDWILAGAVFFLSLISLLSLYSASLKSGGQYFNKQLIFILLGVLMMFLFSLIDYRIFRNYTFIIVACYVVAILLLILVLVVGKHTRGTMSWFSIGQLKFEPIEMVKLVLILLLAKYFSLKHVHIRQIRYITVSVAYFLVLVALVMMQPDLGSAMVLGTIWLGEVLLSGMKVRHLLAVVVIGILIFSVSWVAVLKNYQKQRIISFLNPTSDLLGSGYNQSQSIIAIGSGGLFGKGLGRGSQVQLNFLPEKETDFIFSALSEEWGLFGALIVLLLYGIIAWRILIITLQSDNNFAKLFSGGVLIMLFSSVLINIGMNLGIMPIAGISLPFLSYGGSGILFGFISLGILQSINIRSGQLVTDWQV